MVNVYSRVIRRAVRCLRVLLSLEYCFGVAGQERKVKWRIFMLSTLVTVGGYVLLGETRLIVLLGRKEEGDEQFGLVGWPSEGE